MKCQNDWNDFLSTMIHVLITKLHKSNKELLTVMLFAQRRDRQVGRTRKNPKIERKPLTV